MPVDLRIGDKQMTRKAPIQLPLRRAYLLQQPRHMRGLVIALLWYKRKMLQREVAHWLGVSQSFVSKAIDDWTFAHYSLEDELEAERLIENLSGPMFAGHY